MIGVINRKISDIAVLNNVLPQAQPPNHQALEPDRDPHPIGYYLHLQNQDTVKIWIMCMSKTRDHIKIKIKMSNPSQEPPVTSKALNEDLKDMDVLCTLKIKIESLNLNHECTKDH